MFFRRYKSNLLSKRCEKACPYDLAVLIVDQPFPINDFIRPACLPTVGWTENLKDGRMVISGMGRANPEVREPSPTLKITTIPMRSKSQCKLGIGSSFKGSNIMTCPYTVYNALTVGAKHLAQRNALSAKFFWAKLLHLSKCS